MRALYCNGAQTIALREVRDPEPVPGWVVIKVVRSGVCGSELHHYRKATPHPKPMGHEIVGEVVAVGDGCRISRGARVGSSVIVGCRNCQACKAKDYIFCNHKKFLHGAHADYFAAPEFLLTPLPDEVSWDLGVLVTGDALGVPYNMIVKKLKVTRADTVLVIGVGPVGLGMIALLSHIGARTIAMDLSDYRLTLARQTGADRVIKADGDNARQQVYAITGEGPEKVIECVGRNETFNLALECVRTRGMVGQAGELFEATFNPSKLLIHKEIMLTGAWYYNMNDVKGLMKMVAQGFDPTPMITHHYPLEDAQEAYREFAAGKTGKVLLTP